MIRFASLALLVALAAASCTPDNGSASTTAPASTTSLAATTTTTKPPDGFGGEVTVGVRRSLQSLNPLTSGPLDEPNLAGQAVWATVYDIVPETWERVPDAVSSLPSNTPGAIEVGEDGSMTVRYEIASGATWSDGTPMTGADLAFTAERMAELALTGGVDVDSVMSTVTETDSLDRIAWITFSEPSLAFEDALWVILPSHAIGDTTNLRTDDGFGWPTGGPFVVAAEQQPNVLTLDRNPNYWKTDDNGRQLPYIDRLSIVGGNDPQSLLDLFTTEAADLIVDLPQPDSAEPIPDGAEAQIVPIPIVEHITFQFGLGRDVVNSESLNDDLEYRTAVAHAIDRSVLLEDTGVPWMARTPGVLVPTGNSAWSSYLYDTSMASTLVDSVVGEDDGTPRAFLSTTGNGDYRPRMGDALVVSLGDIGVNLRTSYVDSLIFYGDQLGSGEFDIGMWAWDSNGGFGNQIELMQRLDPAAIDARSNFGNWGDEASESDGSVRFSELVEEVRATADPVRFHQIVDEAEQILASDLPLIPLFQRSSLALLWPNAVSGVTHNGSRSGAGWNMEVWQKPGE